VLRPRPLFVALLALAACKPDATGTAVAPRGEAPAVTPAAPALRRLTQAQYTNCITSLLGEGLVLPSSLEPDTAIDGLYSEGAAATSISPVGVSDYEEAAYSLAEQVMADPVKKASVVGCEPGTDGCARTFVTTFGRRAWRRTLTEDEITRLVAVSDLAATTLADADAGPTYALAAMLQSPHFLYREELGETDPDDPTARRYTSEEMATRLAFFLWNTTPDDTLLDAGAAGELVTDTGLATQVERLLADDRAHEGVRTLFAEMLDLYALDDLAQDPTLFLHMSPEVGPAAREETLLDIEALVFSDGDYRDLFTTRTTYLDPVLASLYGVRAPAREGFGETELPADGGRAGFLGQTSFLALQAHPTATSATRRGKFIREVLLCQSIPAPPAGVDTSIPEADADSPTLRDRIATHTSDPTCAGCHLLTDPIGLGLENFDALGGWRLTENGATIDASGTLDGDTFADAVGLGQAVSRHEQLAPCLAETVYRYATAHAVGDGEEALVDWHAQGFAEAGYAVKALLADVAESPGFRRVGAVE
jgi:hypothetical protein